MTVWATSGRWSTWANIECFWQRTVEPVSEPVTATEAKDHARITGTADDNAITRFIQAAREAAEQYTNRGLLTQTWKMTLSTFAEVMYLPMAAPLQSVSSVKYYDVDGNLQTLSNSFYTVDTVSLPGRVTRAANQTYPSLQADRYAGRVEITYVVGWTAANLIPERIKQGMRMYIAYMDADREGLTVEGDRALKAAEACWENHKVTWVEPSQDWIWWQ